MKYRRRLTSTVAAALALGAAGTASAAAPTPCTGLQAKDPAGDATIGLAGNQTAIPAGANVDLTGLFFNREASGRTTVNAMIAKLDKTVPPDAAGNVYRFFWTVKETDFYAQATVRPDGTVAYSYGHIETTLVSDGEAKGEVSEGENGVVSIDIPASHGGKLGDRFTDAYVLTAYSRGAFLTSTDFAPDGDGRVSWNGAVCPTAETPGGSEPTAPGVPADPTTPPSPAPEPSRPAVSGPLQVSVSPTAVTGRKVKRKLSLTLKTKEQLTSLQATLKKGSAKVATGRLARLSNSGRLVLAVKRKLKKGTYALVLDATRADGSKGTVTLRLKVR